MIIKTLVETDKLHNSFVAAACGVDLTRSTWPQLKKLGWKYRTSMPYARYVCPGVGKKEEVSGDHDTNSWQEIKDIEAIIEKLQNMADED